MTNFHTLNKTATKLIMSAGALALIAGLSINMAPQAYATDCLLDTNLDGNADSNVDTDGGADSGGDPERLACGVGADAAGSFSTALGGLANAAGGDSTALGYLASSAEFQSTALGSFANAAGFQSTALGSSAGAVETSSTAVGQNASAAETNSTALGHSANASGFGSTAIGKSASAALSNSTTVGTFSSASGEGSTSVGALALAPGLNATALGISANAVADNSTALGSGSSTGSIFAPMATAVGANAQATGDQSTALGSFARASTTHSIAIGGGGATAALSAGVRAIAIGNQTIAGHSDAIVIGSSASTIEDGQIILGSADTFTIRGNGNMGVGTATPAGNLDINSGAADTTLLLSNTSAQWELKSKASTGRLNFKNLTAGGVPFKLGSTAVNSLLSVGTAADDLVEVRGALDVDGDVTVTGTLTTGGPTCGGGCDAVFDADYDLPSIEEHAAQMFANKHLPEIGPTIPLAPINLSEQYGRMLNELEKAHIYIAQLQAEKKSEVSALEARLEQQNTRLGQQNTRLELQNVRLERLEALLAD